MIRQLCCILFLFLSSVMVSQNWDTIRGGRFKNQIASTLFDSVHNKLLVSSKFNVTVGPLNARGICSWNSIKWDSLAGGINTHEQVLNPQNPDGMALTCIPFNGKLLVGGYFTSIGGVNSTGMALWDGTKWDTLPKKAFRYDKQFAIDDFLKKGNLLYIAGSFDTIAGQPASGLATWDGINFNPILLPVAPGFQGVYSMALFQNEIYITGGLFDYGTHHARDIFKFNGTSWVSTTGEGLTGSITGINQLTVYNNELYAAGFFNKASGNIANNIMKWNGTSWKDIGFGTSPNFASINKMLVYHNKLWVFGGFDAVANQFTSNVAVYDGVNWCGLKDTLDNNIGSATVYNDTIYIGGGFWKANSDSVKFIAKLKNPALFNSCVNVGIGELSYRNQISIYPNPTGSSLNITDEQNELQNATIDITNSIGQTVLQVPFNNSVDVSILSAGCYFLNITTTDKRMLHSKFIKE